MTSLVRCFVSRSSLGNPLIDPVMEYLQPFPCTADADCAAFGVTCGGNGLCDNEGGISVISGSVYRGSQNPALVGQFVFGDFSDPANSGIDMFFGVKSANT